MTRDLIVLAADKSIEAAIKGILGRTQSLRIKPLGYDTLVHPGRDPGCFRDGDKLLTQFVREYLHGLVVFDKEWDGAPFSDAKALAADVDERLGVVWGDRAKCVVIDPELESWVWSDSPHVATILGWENRNPGLRERMKAAGLWPDGSAKPTDPKRAYELALREANLPRSSSIFRALASRVGFERCSDASFQLLVDTLRGWFGQEGNP